GGIPEMKLSAIFSRETRGFKRGKHSHFLKDGLIVREQGFANVKAGEVLFFQDQHAFSSAGQVGGGSASAGTTANNHCVVRTKGHPSNEAQKERRSKRRKRLVRAVIIVCVEDSAIVKATIRSGRTNQNSAIREVDAQRRAPGIDEFTFVVRGNLATDDD